MALQYKTKLLSTASLANIAAGVACIMSDPSIDHYGDSVGLNWVLPRKSYIALFNHDSNTPIGRFEDVGVRSGALRGRLAMAPEGTTQKIDELRKLIQCGVLTSVSVGFRALEQPEPIKSGGGGLRYTKQELVECSLVCVAANSAALLEAKRLGVSAETIKMIFKTQNRNATIGERLDRARANVKHYTDREKAEVIRKARVALRRAQATLATPRVGLREAAYQARRDPPPSPSSDQWTKGSTSDQNHPWYTGSVNDWPVYEDNIPAPKPRVTSEWPSGEYVMWQGKRIYRKKWPGE